MKKNLIALSVAGLFAAMAGAAHAEVTINGSLDIGLKSVSNDKNSQANSTAITGNNSSTSLLQFRAKEDLGDGLSVGVMLEMNPTVTQSNINNTAAPSYTGSPFNGEQYVSLTSNMFGDLKLGTPNSPGFNAGAMAQPFGTGMGSGYSAGFGRLGTSTVSGYNQYVGGALGAGRILRSEKAAVYTSPRFNDFNVQLEYSFGNSSSDTFASNDNRILGLGVNYNKGPLNVSYFNGTATSGGVAAAGAGGVANALGANGKVVYNILSANYNVDKWTGYAGYTTTLGDNAASVHVEDSRSWNLGVKYQVNPSTAVMANYLERVSGLASQDDGVFTPRTRLLGVGANYSLSKSTMLYARAEVIRGVNVAAAAAVNGADSVAKAGDAQQTSAAVGMKVAF